ncbi:MAG: hypothetical protein IT350_12260 [Deltaproteobacteria bacterium]|nr:hypothetical protein [Deltaproteobacteria bacterium]
MARVVLLMALCAALVAAGACSKKADEDKPPAPSVPTEVPAPDVPIFEPAVMDAREAGPGGYRLMYTTHSPMESVLNFIETRWVERGWIAVASVPEKETRKMLYFRKDQRLLMAVVELTGEDGGCRFTVMETLGESPRGNVLTGPAEEGAPPEAQGAPEGEAAPSGH